MTTRSSAPALGPEAPLRFVTATSLFDGHDAAINIIRRLLQSSGAEVVHLGHNRAVEEVVQAALQEDAQGIALSTYQGGHMEYFRYVLDRLAELGASHIRVFGGGGGVIRPAEIATLHGWGVARVYAPADGLRLGLQGMIDDMLRLAAPARHAAPTPSPAAWKRRDPGALAGLISRLERGESVPGLDPAAGSGAGRCPVLGITGTGGAGKSSFTDELLQRFRLEAGDELRLAVLAVDPSRRRSGGALLGDRLRMNAACHPATFLRSLATRGAGGEMPACLPAVIDAVQAFGFDLIIVETPGIGQGDAGLVPLVDVCTYVMTPEFGAATQLEKIDMLDFADCVVINKFDRSGAADAYREVVRQVRRNRLEFDREPEQLPVYGVTAAHFNDDGVTAAYQGLVALLRVHGLRDFAARLPRRELRCSSGAGELVPHERRGYLLEVAEAVEAYHRHADREEAAARRRQQLRASRELLAASGAGGEVLAALDELLAAPEQTPAPASLALLDDWPELRRRCSADGPEPGVEANAEANARFRHSASGSAIPRVALPRGGDDGELLRWLLLENAPGRFPFTAGVFPLKREGEDPTRMFAGEGAPERTNRRFHRLSDGFAAKRLSTAFDSVTLYGADPDERPDVFGKIGNAGVSVATLEDVKALYAGFDLCDPATSVSMTINGPAPAVLAMFFNAAIDQQVEAFTRDRGRAPDEGERRALQGRCLSGLRGTVQADILKEDQGQNTCLFSTEFSLRMMGDMQQYFIDQGIRHFYAVSVSGYHIAEAGANPITQLAFTLANGLTLVEYYLARGMAVDDFAPSFSFFFSNGMDPEYAVMGRVARRIWAVAMRDCYGAGERAQRLKYHIQTSGRSLHEQAMEFNDIRTTLQALLAIYDNCNSLHTNAFDEAVTTPTEGSVRRALAIQQIIQREFGPALNENPLQGAFIIEALTALVEAQVLEEFRRLARRGGVLGAMETGYQRGRIQDESMAYERRKHDGSQPIVGVNTLRAEVEEQPAERELARSSEEERWAQIERTRRFRRDHAQTAPAALARFKRAVLDGDNAFEALMAAVRHCTLGEITEACFAVGGQYRRNM